MAKFTKFIFDYLKRRQRENERDLDFFESDLYHFLKLLYVKGELKKDEIKKKRRFSEEKFYHFINFAEGKKYIHYSTIKPSYSITQDGIDFLLKLDKSRKEQARADWIKGATIVLAISAIVSIIDILINRPNTKSYIINNLAKIFIEGVGVIIQLTFLLIGLWILFRIIIFIKDRYKKKTNNQNL